MAQKQYPIINNFSKGELSSRMEGRVDIQGYYQGCKTMRNCIMVAQGGAEKRPGTIYLGEVSDATDEVKLIPWEISDTEIYIIELGFKYARIWDTQTDSLVQQDAVDLVLDTAYLGEDISAVQYQTVNRGIYLVHPNYPITKITKELVGTEYRYQISRPVANVPVWIAGTYLKGQVVFDGTDYFRAIKTTDSTAPVAGEWEYRDHLAGITNLTGDITTYTGGDFSAGDVKIYSGNVYKALRTFTGPVSGQTVCFPETEIWDWLFDGTDIEEKIIAINPFDLCKKWWTIFCTDSYTPKEYAEKKYNNYKTKVLIAIPLGIDITSGKLGIALTIEKAVYQTTIGTVDQYWERVASVPGGSDVDTVHEFVATTYNKGDVVYNSAMNIYVSVSDNNTGTPGTEPQWEFLPYNPFFTAAGDFPSAIAVLNQRLYLAGTVSHPQTIYGSRIGDYEDFNIGIDDDDPLEFTISSEQSSRIKWLLGRDQLFIGTVSGEWLATGGANGITPTSIQVLKQSAYGSAFNRAMTVADSILFYQKGGKKLREYIYSNDNKAYLAQDLTFFADHITLPGIVESSYQQNPDSILWNTKEGGGLIGLTYDRTSQIAGWHRHDTYGEFESVASVIGSTGEDELWFVVSRKINGNYHRFIEKMAPRRDNDVYSDSSVKFSAGSIFSVTSITYNTTYVEVTYEGSTGIANDDYIKLVGTDSGLFDYQDFIVKDLNQGADTGTLRLYRDGDYFLPDSFTTITTGTMLIVTDTVTGLDHLLGETVDILGDGSVFPPQEVVDNVDGAGGVGIVLSSRCNNVICGLNYRMELEPESIELQGTMSSTRRISKVTLKLYNTLGGYVGSDINNMEELRFRSTSLPFGMPVPKFTGTIDVPIDTSSEKESSVLIFHNQPLPMTVLAIISDVTYSRS